MPLEIWPPNLQYFFGCLAILHIKKLMQIRHFWIYKFWELTFHFCVTFVSV